ncbi:MAG: protein-disulfide reductase DsbD family protein [Pseudomonadota bacterium]
MFQRLLRHFLPALAVLSFAAGPSVAQTVRSTVATEHVRAELVAHAPDGLGAGKPAWLGLRIEHQPEWHTYWKNPGDSGLPTTLAWTLPAGADAGEIAWPAPHKLPVGPLVNYGYEGVLLLPVPLKLAEGVGDRGLEVALRADWLVCREVCIPESGEFRLKLPAGASVATHGAEFEQALSRVPAALASGSAKGSVQGQGLAVEVAGLPAAWRGQPVEYFAEDAGVIDHAAKPAQRWEGDRLLLQVPLSPQRSESPEVLQAVLTQGSGAVQVGFTVEGGWPAVAPAPAVTPAPEASPAPLPAPAEPAGPLALTLVLALAGGLLLNLMPCVFPVLSLKVFGFAAHAHERRLLAAGGLAYTAGVIVSFVALAGLLLALRAAGGQLGWGFQLQSPPFVAGLALLFTLIGLNLLGVFELGGVLPGSLGGLQVRHPVVDHALTGVLAVLIASPCTAPFMGAALGAALTLPTGQALLVFAFLGLGMALPYLLASLWPQVGRWLPRPGAWMVRFKALMAFPMFATVVWLLWVLGQQAGIDGAAAMLGLLLAVALLLWIWGAGFGPRARGALAVAAGALLLAAGTWTWPLLAASTPEAVAEAAPADRWQPWSTTAVADAQAQGRPVFVDFTAAWCVTCQYNKRSTLADEALMAELDRKRVVFLRADWTRRDAAISQELARLGRSGVPVYALYTPGQSQPVLLSELLSVAEVRRATADWPSTGPVARLEAASRPLPP